MIAFWYLLSQLSSDCREKLYLSNGLTSKIHIKTSQNFQGSHDMNGKECV